MSSIFLLEQEYNDINFDQLANKHNEQNTEYLKSENNSIDGINLDELLTIDNEESEFLFIDESGDTINLVSSKEWNHTNEDKELNTFIKTFDSYLNYKNPSAKLFVDEDITII